MLNLRSIVSPLFILMVGFILNYSQISGQGLYEDVTQKLSNSNSFHENVNLVWSQISELALSDGQEITRLSFESATFTPSKLLPLYSKTFYIGKNNRIVTIDLIEKDVSSISGQDLNSIQGFEFQEDFQINYHIGQSAGENYLYLTVNPIRVKGGVFEKLESFEYDVKLEQDFISRGSRNTNSWRQSSVLSSGDWLKLATGKDGVYKITFNQLINTGLISGSVLSNSIRFFGTPAGMLSTSNNERRSDDLQEFAIQIEDGGDDSFDAGDYLLFYGEDQDVWTESGARFVHAKNFYSDSNYYFLTIDPIGGSPSRVAFQNLDASNIEVNSYDYYDFHEVDLSNLIKSGRRWYGEQLGAVLRYDFGFSVPNVITSEKAFVIGSYAARSVSLNGTKMKMKLLNQSVAEKTNSVSYVSSGYALRFAQSGFFEFEFLPSNSNFNTSLEYDNSANPQAQAWIDEIEINARRELRFLPPFMPFRDRKSATSGERVKFKIQHFDDQFFVWDITNQTRIIQPKILGDATDGYYFTQTADTLREFIVCSSNVFESPSFLGLIQNQDLHSLRNIDYIIVTHKNFTSQAERIAEFHRNEGMSVQVVEVSQIYNEFSGGAQDITAIKEFVRMLYKRGEFENGVAPKYLLLFGDASYDYKNKVSGNSNFVPSFQTMESLEPTASIVSDDYFGTLDDTEGQAANDLVDIGVGRFPARTLAEATAMVNKTLEYSSAKSYGGWRNWMAFVSDDAEPSGNAHIFMEDCDELSEIVEDSASNMNIQKLFMDSFKQEAGSGGQRYPDGAKAISERVDKGALLMYYIGHGGELGWAHERILEVSTINKWSNSPRMPVFVTATCEFTRFDDPRRTSAGEYVLLNPDGGGVALLTTTRAVYANPNLTLTTQFTKAAFSSIANGQQRLGDLSRVTKVRSLALNDSTVVGENALIADNTRCFSLLGDPALKLAYPEYNVQITEMPDTIRALDKVKVRGMIVDDFGAILNDFNGIVIPVIFDKMSQLRTLDNDGRGAYDYEERRNIIFRGKVQVIAGTFEFEFIVPKDIEKEFGIGKVSTYAYDNYRDASGSYFDFIIGGNSNYPVLDEDGPEVKLYMNNSKFIFGGLTDEDPDLYAEIYDISGVNMVGSGIGHDIIAVLDNNTGNTLVLNDYYEADINSYQSGKVRYPFNNLDEGLHQLKFQVWDVNNNPTDDYTEFVVANSADLALDHVLNYPNPFTTNTSFFFEHNKPGQELNVDIEIFTVSGKLVKSIRGYYISDGYRVGPIAWDGLDEYGDVIGKGVYLYKLKVNAEQGQTVEQFERLVILN